MIDNIRLTLKIISSAAKIPVNLQVKDNLDELINKSLRGLEKIKNITTPLSSKEDIIEKPKINIRPTSTFPQKIISNLDKIAVDLNKIPLKTIPVAKKVNDLFDVIVSRTLKGFEDLSKTSLYEAVKSKKLEDFSLRLKKQIKLLNKIKQDYPALENTIEKANKSFEELIKQGLSIAREYENFITNLTEQATQKKKSIDALLKQKRYSKKLTNLENLFRDLPKKVFETQKELLQQILSSGELRVYSQIIGKPLTTLSREKLKEIRRSIPQKIQKELGLLHKSLEGFEEEIVKRIQKDTQFIISATKNIKQETITQSKINTKNLLTQFKTLTQSFTLPKPQINIPELLKPFLTKTQSFTLPKPQINISEFLKPFLTNFSITFIPELKKLLSSFQNIKLGYISPDFKGFVKETSILNKIGRTFVDINKHIQDKNKNIKKEKDLLEDELDHLDRMTFLFDLIALKLFYIHMFFDRLSKLLFDISRLSFGFLANTIKNSEELLLIERRLVSLYENVDKSALLGIATFEKLNLMAIRTVYTTAQLTEAFTQFKAIGLDNIQIFELVIDTATAFGIEVEKIADDVARALEGDATAFKNLRHSIGLTNQNLVKFGGVLDSSGRLLLRNSDALEKNRQAVIRYLEQYKGLAEKTVGTLPQQLKNLSDAFKIFQLELIKTLSFIGDFANVITNLILTFNRLNPTTKSFIASLITGGSIATGIFTGLFGILTSIAAIAASLLSTFITAFSALGILLVQSIRYFGNLEQAINAVVRILNEAVRLQIISEALATRITASFPAFRAFLLGLLNTILNTATALYNLFIRFSLLFSIATLLITIGFAINQTLKTQIKLQEQISNELTTQTKQYFEIRNILKGISDEHLLLLSVSEEYADKNKEIFELLDDIKNTTKLIVKLNEDSKGEVKDLVDLYLKLSKTTVNLADNLQIDAEKLKKNIKSVAVYFATISAKDYKDFEKIVAKINEDINALTIKSKGSLVELQKEIANKIREGFRLTKEEIEKNIKPLEEKLKELETKADIFKKAAEKEPKGAPFGPSYYYKKTMEDIKKVEAKINKYKETLELLQKREQELIQKTNEDLEKQYNLLKRNLETLMLYTKTLIQKSLIKENLRDFRNEIQKLQNELLNIKPVNLTNSFKELNKVLDDIYQTNLQMYEIQNKIKNIEDKINKGKEEGTLSANEENNLLKQKSKLEQEYIRLSFKSNDLLKQQEQALSRINEQVKQLNKNLQTGFYFKNLLSDLQAIGINLKNINSFLEDQIKKNFQEISKLIKEDLGLALKQASNLVSSPEALKEIEKLKNLFESIKNMDKEQRDKTVKQISQQLENILRSDIILNKISDRFSKLIKNLDFSEVYNLLYAIDRSNKGLEDVLIRRLGLNKEEVKILKETVGLNEARLRLIQQINSEDLIRQEIDKSIEDTQRKIAELEEKETDKFKIRNQALKEINNLENKIRQLTANLPYLADEYLKKVKEIRVEWEKVKENLDDYVELVGRLKELGIDVNKIKPKELGLDEEKFKKAIEMYKETKNKEAELTKQIFEDIYNNAIEKIEKKFKDLKDLRDLPNTLAEEVKKLREKGINLNKNDIYDLWKRGRQVFKEFLENLKSQIEDLKDTAKELTGEEEQIPEEFKKFKDFADKVIKLGEQMNNYNLRKLGEQLKFSIPRKGTSFGLEGQETERKYDTGFQIFLVKAIQEQLKQAGKTVEENMKDVELFRDSVDVFSNAVNNFKSAVDIMSKSQKTTTTTKNITIKESNPILDQLFK